MQTCDAPAPPLPCATPFTVDARAGPGHCSPAMTATLANAAQRPLLPILVALSGAHLLNDLIQSMIPAMYPLIKESVPARLRADRPDHARVPGDVVAAAAAARLRHRSRGRGPTRWSAGMCSTLAGLLGLAFAPQLRDGARRRRPGRARARPCSTRKRRAWRAMPRPASTVSRRASSRSAATPAMRSGPLLAAADRGAARPAEPRLGVGRGARRDGADGVDGHALCRNAPLAGGAPRSGQRRPARPPALPPARTSCWR